MKNKLKTIIVIYVAGAILTFGACWRDCTRELGPHSTDGAVMFVPVMAAVWPLYWSVKFWEVRDGH